MAGEDSPGSLGMWKRDTPMKLTHEERRRTRELVGLDPLDSCPVVLVDGPQQSRLVGEAGQYINDAGDRLRTVKEMQRAGPDCWRFIVTNRRIEVGNSWLLAYRSSVRSSNKGIPL